MSEQVRERSIDQLLHTDVEHLDRAGLAERLQSLERSQSRLEAARLATIRRFEAVEGPSFDSAVNATSWLAVHTGTSRRTSARQRRLATLAPEMPLSVAALGEGTITLDHLHVLARCTASATIERWRADEEMLVAMAQRLEDDELAKAVVYWLAMADGDGAEPPAGRGDTAFFSRTMAGRGVLHADLGPDAADELEAALDEKYQELWRADRAAGEIDPDDPIVRRTPAERRAAALMELIGLGAGADDELTERRRPSVTVLADHHTAGGHATDDPLHETDRGRVISRRRLAEMLCDCTAGLVLTGADGAPVDLGRATRTPSAAQRRALVARDKGCRVGGCGRPPRWCDAHHIVPWTEGGATDLRNLVLLCRHHHSRLHRGQLLIRVTSDGQPQFLRPDGTLIESTRGPPQTE